MPLCPVCDAMVPLEANPAAPFCSDRCRLIDLGRWLDESYAVPEGKRSLSDDGEEEAAAEAPE